MAQKFENQDMAGTLFHNINLAEATFDDVNMAGTKIQNANLAGLSIDNANIADMTIFGIPVQPLIEEELDRRDPERAGLRMKDKHDPQEIAQALANLEQLRGDFRTLLRSASTEQLGRRPAEGTWSAIEHLRHLVFAEDLYLNRWILRNDQTWSKLGLLPDFLAGNPSFADVGNQPDDDLETILSVWDGLCGRAASFAHDATHEQLACDTSDIDFGQGTVGGVLQGMAMHDMHHIRAAKAAISAAK
jgi:hypothetical protein